jgi:hypothetical protein
MAERQAAGSSPIRAMSCWALSPSLAGTTWLGLPLPLDPGVDPGGVAPGSVASLSSLDAAPFSLFSYWKFCSVMVTPTLARSGVPSGAK